MVARMSKRAADAEQAEDAVPAAIGAPKKNKRRKKDPKAPKKPLTAFVYFGQTMRPKLLQKDPSLTFTQVGAELGKLWGALSKAGRRPYDKKAEEDKERYAKEIDGYVPDAAYLQSIAKQGAQRLKKDPAKPKRSRSAYLVFCDKHRPEIQKIHSDKKMTEVAVEVAKLWGKVSDKERAACEKIAAKEKAEYEKLLSKYTPSEEFLKAKESLEAARNAEKLKATEAKKKAKEKLTKTKNKMKELQADINKIQKAVAAAEKAKVKVPQMKLDLEKTEAKLREILGEA